MRREKVREKKIRSIIKLEKTDTVMRSLWRTHWILDDPSDTNFRRTS